MSAVAEVRGALGRAARVGSYFAVATSASGRDGWRPWADLVDDPGLTALSERVAFARTSLAGRSGGDVTTRVAASIDSLGMMARLVAPVLATASLAGIVPVLDETTVRWRPVDGALHVAFTTTTARRVRTAADAADAIAADVLIPVVAPLLRAYRTGFHVSPLALRGNVASALHGAAGLLPAGPVDPSEILTALLDLDVLAGSVRSTGPRFRRNNCCLFHRVPGAGACADCVLTP